MKYARRRMAASEGSAPAGLAGAFGADFFVVPLEGFFFAATLRAVVLAAAGRFLADEDGVGLTAGTGSAEIGMFFLGTGGSKIVLESISGTH